MVAARNIKAGELVISEEPLFSVQSSRGAMNYYELLEKVKLLPQDKLSGFLGLHNAN